MLTTLPHTEFEMSQRAPNARLRNTYRNLALWTLQGWLAMFFIAAGYAKLTEPMDNLIVLLKWPEYVSPGMVTNLGIIELVLAAGILAPLITWRLRIVTVGSAGVLMMLAMTMLCVHLADQDFGLAAVNLVLAVIAGAVVHGRRAASAR